MARIFEEFFEATGYDEAGWTETVPGTCVVDEDEASSAAGSPPLWGSQCLEVSGDGAGADCHTYNIFGDGAVRFAAVDFKISALGFDVNGQQASLFYMLNAALSVPLTIIQIARSAGVNRIRCIVYHDATANFITDDVLTLDKLYRYEIKWDETTDTWEIWLDNVSRGSGSLTLGAATTQCGAVLLGDVLNSVRTFTCRYDRVEVDNASRIGGWAENVTGTASPTEAADAPSASGVIVNIGAGAPQEIGDDVSGSGSITVLGAASPVEAADTASAAGIVTLLGSASPVEAADTASAAGIVTLLGSASPVEADDTADASGGIPLDITGAAAPSEANDIAAGAGIITVSGSASPAEADDAASASGAVTEHLTLVEDADYVVSAVGRLFTVAAAARDYTVAANGRNWEVAA